MRPPPLGRPSQASGSRPAPYWNPQPSGTAPTDRETAYIVVWSDMLRTAVVTFLLGSIATLLIYFSIGAAAGEGRSMFRLTAAAGVFLTCGAAACRERRWLRFPLALGALCVFALLVDQVAYYEWHERVDSLVTKLEQGLESGSPALPGAMNVRPTSFRIDPDRKLLLTFEPPLLAWTYHLDSASSLGHRLVAGWYHLLSSVKQEPDVDPVARTILYPHEAYSIGVMSDERVSACRQDEGRGQWVITIDTRSGFRPL